MRFLSSQIIFYALVGMGIAVASWSLTVWAAYDLWHPPGSSAFNLSPNNISHAKLVTIGVFYIPFGVLMGAGVSLIQPTWNKGFWVSVAGDAKRGVRSEWKMILLGVILGGLGLGLGGIAGEYILDHVQTPSLGRVIGASVMGLVLGLSIGAIGRIQFESDERLVAGVVGGALGGCLSALLFQFVRPGGVTGGSMLALMLFAACVLGAVGAVSILQTKAWLVGIRGNGFKYDQSWVYALTTDAPTAVGSVGSKAKLQLWEESIAANQAEIGRDRQGRWYIKRGDEAQAQELSVNDRAVPSGGRTTALRHGDHIKIGRKLVFTFMQEQ
jgi:hypothetical protein